MKKTSPTNFLTSTPNSLPDLMLTNLGTLRNVAVVLLSAFFLSCEDPKDIGFDVDGGTNLSTFFTDTLAISQSTLLLDSAITSDESQLLLGGFVDPVLGYAKSEAYFQPSLPINTQTGAEIPFAFEETVVYDSLSLSFSTSRYFLGDTLTKIKFDIYRLAAPLAQRNYNNNEIVAVDPSPIASFTMNLDRIYNVTRDSTRNVTVRLPDDIGRELEKLKNTDDSKTTVALTKKFPGFAVRANGKPVGVYGFTASLNGGSSLNWFFHRTNETTALAVPFNLGGKRFNQIQADRKGTVLELLTQRRSTVAKATTNGLTYVQASVGLGTRIELPTLSRIAKESLVNSAFISFPVDTTKFSRFFPPLTTLVLAELDDNNRIRRSATGLPVLVNGGRGTAGTPAVYNPTTKSYTIDVTAYLQDVLNGLRPTTRALALVSGSITQNNAGAMSNPSFSRVPIGDAKLFLYYSLK